jgi:hypothetical protein
MKKLHCWLFLISCAWIPQVSAQRETEGEPPFPADTRTQGVLPPFLSAATAAGLDARKLQWYDSWVTQYPNDSPPDLNTEDPEELNLIREGLAAEEERREAIRRDPGILPYLKALFWLHHRAPDNNATGGVKSILEAMTMKPELNEADVADITAEVDRILATPFTGRDGDSHNYLLSFYAETIIRRFPSQANVDRCVKIIERSESIDWRFPKFWVLRVLTEIGGHERLPLAQATHDWLDARRSKYFSDDFSHTQANEAKQLIAAMRLRLAGSTTTAAIPQSVSKTNSASGSFPIGLNPIWVITGLAILAVLVPLLRRTAGKKNSETFK